MAHQWRGVVKEYFNRLPVKDSANSVTLGEGGTPLVRARSLSELTQCDVYIKVEGVNPTGSFKDRGMAMAMTAAVEDGSGAVVCASTGNTSASAAAYAVRAGLPCAVLVPGGKIAVGKLSQAIAHGARLLQIDGNFDDCLRLARELAERFPVLLVNSVNPARIEGQKTAAFEVVDVLGDAPDIHILPVGNAGNITAYWKGYSEYSRPYANKAGLMLDAHATKRPRMWGFQASGAAPLVSGAPVENPETVATAIRIGNPASWDFAVAARDESGGFIGAVTDTEILAAHRYVSMKEGIFVEPASAAGIAGLLRKHASGEVPRGQKIVITVTGHGLKDPQWALKDEDNVDIQPQKAECDVSEVAVMLELS